MRDAAQAVAVTGHRPGVDPGHVGRRDDQALLLGVPDHAVGRVAQDRTVDLGIEVELGQRVVLVDVEQRLLCGTGALVVHSPDRHRELQAPHQVAGQLVDHRPGVVDGQAAAHLLARRPPLAALVERQVAGVAALAVTVRALELFRQGEGAACRHQAASLPGRRPSIFRRRSRSVAIAQ
jgi:hypothetical protein